MTVKSKSVNRYYKKFGKYPDLENPKSYNDKIQWLKIYDQDIDQVMCCDKLAVKEYIATNYDPSLIIPNTSEYPAVLKANNGSGGIEFVSSPEEETLALERINVLLKKQHGKNKGEWAYSLIEPNIVREKRINNNDVDYKFHCCNGKVKWLQMIWDRYSGKTKESNIDPNGNPMSWHFDEKMQHVEVPPHCGLDKFFEMKQIAENLSKRWKYVRVDLYYGEGKPWFGELTFWPKAGYYKTPDQEKFGQLLDFDLTTKKTQVVE
jgi:hypothetical protein